MIAFYPAVPRGLGADCSPGDPMTFAVWCLIVGGLLVVMALAGSVLKRLPLTASMLYLAVGIAVGPSGGGLLRVDPIEHAGLLEHVVAYLGTTLLFALGYPGMKYRITAMLIIYAGVLEAMQSFSPGRHPTELDASASVVGVLLGVAGAAAATRLLSGLLFEVSATDPAVFAGIAVSVLLVGACASYLPARRAARADPMISLRNE